MKIEQGFNTIVSDCKDMRRYALAGKVALDESVHRDNKENLHLFEFIRNCGWDVREFILGYLSCLQPYDLQPFGLRSDIPRGHLWVVSIGYYYSMVIKLRKDSQYGDGLIISFHESRSYGKWNKGSLNEFDNKDCLVIVDDIKNVWGNYNVIFTVQRGFIRRRITAIVSRCENGVATIRYGIIEDAFKGVLDDYLQELYALYLGKESTPLVGEIKLKDLTFTAYGFNTLNNICLLVDLSKALKRNENKRAIYSLLDSILSEVPDGLVEDYHNALRKKYVAGDVSYAYEFADWVLAMRYKHLSLETRDKMKKIRDTWLK